MIRSIYGEFLYIVVELGLIHLTDIVEQNIVGIRQRGRDYSVNWIILVSYQPVLARIYCVCRINEQFDWFLAIVSFLKGDLDSIARISHEF